MAFILSNENPNNIRVGDCVVRAIAKAENDDWYDTYIDLSVQGMIMTDMPDSNRVWMAYLKEIGYDITLLSSDCPNCYSVIDFCRDHPKGIYLLATGDHLIAAINGNYYDTFDSGNEIISFFFVKTEDTNGSV